MAVILSVRSVADVRDMSRTALRNITRRGLNGAFSSGCGSFNSLCGAIALRTGLRFATVSEIAVSEWNDWMDSWEGCYAHPSLQDSINEFEQWHNWEF